MPEKKKEVIIKTKNKVKESKADKFKRIAEPRVRDLINKFRILGNCSNKSNYEYTKIQVDKMFDAIREALELNYTKFIQNAKQTESFKF